MFSFHKHIIFILTMWLTSKWFHEFSTPKIIVISGYLGYIMCTNDLQAAVFSAARGAYNTGLRNAKIRKSMPRLGAPFELPSLPY